MTDRYDRDAPQPRSSIFNPAIVSPLINTRSLSYEQPNHHVVPAGHREVIPSCNSSSTSAAGFIPMRGSSVRERSRSRSLTLDSHNHQPPTIFIETPRRNDGITMDNRDRVLRVTPVKKPSYAHTRPRPIYPSQPVRNKGYEYTNASDLPRYNLSKDSPLIVQQRARGESFKGRTSRPSSMTGYNDLIPRSYDKREGGPPLAIRDRIPTQDAWEQPQIRMSVPAPSSLLAPMKTAESPALFEPIEPPRRNSSRVRATSLYRDREPRLREEYYAVRDEEREMRERSQLHKRHEDGIDQRGYGLRAERLGRSNNRIERSEIVESEDRSERRERVSYKNPASHNLHKEYKSSHVLAASLGLAGAALGIKAALDVSRDSQDDRDDRGRRWRDYDEELRYSNRDDRVSVDLGCRDPKERRNRNDDLPPPFPDCMAKGALNPKDAMDLKALGEILKAAPKEPARTPRESLTNLEDAQILNERRPRDRATKDNQPRIVSPPREKAEEKPLKGILRAPREKFPEDPMPIREGVAPRKDAKKGAIPPDARWTKIRRKLVNPEALTVFKERFEVVEGFVIVLRVLSRDEIQDYADLTYKIRGSFHL